MQLVGVCSRRRGFGRSRSVSGWLIFGDDGLAGHHGDVIGLVVGLSFVELLIIFSIFDAFHLHRAALATDILCSMRVKEVL